MHAVWSISALAAPGVALLVTAGAYGAGAKPPTGKCLDTDYDCQPTSVTAQQLDKMALSVPIDRDLPALIELEPLDPPDAPIRRYMFNARGIMGREVPIEASKGQFCTLSHATNVTLTWFPAAERWSFIVDFNQKAELMAGGLATCMTLPRAEGKP